MRREKIAHELHMKQSKITYDQGKEIIRKRLKIYFDIREEDIFLFIENVRNLWEIAPPQNLISIAIKSCFIWELTSGLLHDLLQEEKILPIELRDFAALALKHPELKPKHQGRDPILNFFRDYCLRTSVYLLQQLGYHPTTRNETSGKYSACDIVSSAYFEATRIRISYETIRKIWQKISEREKKDIDSKIINYQGQDLNKLENLAAFIVAHFYHPENFFAGKRKAIFDSYDSAN